jgi:phosphoglycerate dehydrogenase-like enzyme
MEGKAKVVTTGMASLRMVTQRPLPPHEAKRLNRALAPDRLEVATVPDLEALKAALPESQVLVTENRPITAEHIALGRDLRLIQNSGCLCDRIDVEAATRAGIPVAICHASTSVSVAEHNVGFMLALAHRIVDGHRSLARPDGAPPETLPPVSPDGSYQNWRGFDHVNYLQGRTLGIIGLGDIGAELARRVRAFGMRVLYLRRRRLPPAEERRLGVRYAPLDELLRRSDFVTLLVPLSQETEGMIGARELALLKPSAFLVNTGRGKLVDEAALVEALRGRAIAGAALDVFRDEPLPAGHPLRTLENVILTPHFAGGSLSTLVDEVVLVFGNIHRALKGSRPQWVVNRVPSRP